jgi:hypothetical protein
MTLFVPIVEGQGEVQAVPSLLNRLADAAGASSAVHVNHPIRVKASSFLHDAGYFARYVAMAAAKAAQSRGHVLILLDCDDDCPATLGPELLERARAVRPDVSMSVCLAYREYETWFIAAAESLRGKFGLPTDLSAPADAERTRDAKGWLSARMGRSYDPIVDQLDFTRAFDLAQARSNRSFGRLADFVRAKVQP